MTQARCPYLFPCGRIDVLTLAAMVANSFSRVSMSAAFGRLPWKEVTFAPASDSMTASLVVICLVVLAFSAAYFEGINHDC